MAGRGNDSEATWPSGYGVSLYSNPQPIIRLINSAPWDADALEAQVERVFGPHRLTPDHYQN